MSEEALQAEGSLLSLVCTYCDHLTDVYEHACEAFTEIPVEIWEGDNDHTSPIDGDHGIQFDPLPEESIKALKVLPMATDDDEEARLAAEQKLMQEIAAILSEYETKAAQDIESRREWNSDELKAELQKALEVNLVDVAEAEFNRQAMMIGVSFDTAVVNVAAAEWAKGYAFDLVKGIDATTKQVISNAVQKFIETPGMTNAELRRMLEPAFGIERAKRISLSETTRAYAQGTNIYQRMMVADGIKMVRRWNTSNDGERVCPRCAPLNRKFEDVWGDDFPAGPPAHVSCRCHLTLSVGDE